MSARKPEKPKPRLGFGARLEAGFEPRLHWGAEFLEDKVRICGLRIADGKAVTEKKFEGSYAEAEEFARAHGLAWQGLHGTVSHLPFKLAALGNHSGASDDEALTEAESLRPDGLPADAVDLQGFQFGDTRFALMLRGDSLQSFHDRLPAPLAGLWDLTLSPLAPLPYLELSGAPQRFAALVPETAHSHVLFFREGTLEAYGKVFQGTALAVGDPAAFLREMKKTLVYHYGSRFPDSSLDALQIWHDGPQGQVASALAGLGIPQVTPVWKAGLVSSPLLAAAAAALRGASAAEAFAPLGVGPAAFPAVRRKWLRRTGKLARFGAQALACLVVIAGMVGLAAEGLGLTVKSKTHAWAGELMKWEAFQQKKAKVEAQMGGLQSLLSRRTESYAGLQRIAQRLPSELWLDTWEAEAAPPRGFSYRLEGYSLVEARVPEFLANLEKAGRFKSVKLKSTEKVKGEVVQEKTGIAANRRDLTHFQLGITE
jgi:Tfp pilus assembly protein PilN